MLENQNENFEEQVQEAVVQDDTFQLNQPERKPAKKKKRKLPWILGAVAIVLVAAAVLVWGYFISGVFLPAKDYMMKVEKKSVSTTVGDIGKVYGALLSSKPSQTQVKTGAKTESHLQLGEDVIEILESYLEQSGEELDLSFLSDIAIDAEMVMEGSMYDLDMGLGLGGEKIITMSMLTNMEDMEAFIGFPELSETFMKISTEMPDIGSAGMATVDYEEMLAAFEQMQDVLPDEETVTGLLEKYMLLILEQIDDVEKETEKVKVGDVEQSLNVITVKLSEKDALKLAKAVLKELKSDKEVKAIIRDIGDYMEENYDAEMDGDAMYDSLKERIESLIDSVEYMIEDADTETAVVIKTYVNGKAEVVGRSIESKENDEEYSYITVWKGDKFGFEAVLPQGIEITGEGTKKKGIVNAEYELVVKDEKILTVEISDFNEDATDSLTMNLRIEPEEELLEPVMDNLNPAMRLLLDDLAIEFQINASGDDAELGFKLLTGEKLLVGMTSKMSTFDGEIEEPDKFIVFNDNAAVEHWIETVDQEDINALFEKLEDAGVPTELLERLLGGNARPYAA